jgi:16S rRNA (guanine527-N7)-methyltransferase
VEHVTAAFPEAASALLRYADWLTGAGVQRGLIGPREADRVWSRHIGNCAALAELIPGPATVTDIGSGAGLPGLVLAIVRPDLRLTLIEPLQRRCDFLAEVVADLDLTVHVVRGRAQDSRVAQADVVTARAVAPLNRLLTWALPLTAPGGQILAMKGANAAAEIAAAAPQLAGRVADIVTCGVGLVEPVTTVVRVTS